MSRASLCLIWRLGISIGHSASSWCVTQPSSLDISGDDVSSLMLHRLQAVDVFLGSGDTVAPYSMIRCTKAIYAVHLQSMG